MANKQKLKPIEYVTCTGCIFIQPYEEFRGHGFCSHRAVKMIQVIETTKQCVWKENGGNKQQETSSIATGV